MKKPPNEITKLLQAWNEGDERALQSLIPLVDAELKRIARNYMRREKPGHILQTTALVNEALIKLIRQKTRLENRKHFYALIAQRMRRILIDYVRKEKGAEYVTLDESAAVSDKAKELVVLDDALEKLAMMDERKATIVKYRFFIGLKLGEIAQLLGVSPTTVEREWRFTRAWLKHEMTGEN
jgi:RNA polymerase sigma factor (TIGR02999 family)